MMLARPLSMMALLLTLLACGSEKPPATKDRATPKILDAQIDALDKAKGVEQLLQDQQNERDEAMQKQGI